jgi:signal transduction histidine kinase
MSLSRKIGIIIYIIIIIQNVITMTALYLNAKRKPDFYRLILFNITIILWLFFGIVESMSIGTDFFYIAVRFTLVPVVFISYVGLYFAVHYTRVLPVRYERWFLIIFILPTIVYIPFLVDNFLPLVIISMDGNRKITEWGPLFIANMNMTRINVVICAILLLRKMTIDGSGLLSRLFLVLSLLLPIILSILDQYKIIIYPDFDLTIVSLSFFLLVIVDLVFRHNFIDVVPYASYEIFTRIKDAVLVSNRYGKIIDFNTSAEDYFSEHFILRSGQSLNLFFKSLSNYFENNTMESKIEHAISMESSHSFEDTLWMLLPDAILKQFSISIMPIWNEDKVQVGKLIHLKDVTTYREKTLETERHRLSDDLHDSMGNCLNVISSNIEYVINCGNHSYEVENYLNIAYEKTISAYLDLRRIVENLQPIDIEKNGVVWALESLFKKLRAKDIDIDFFQDYNVVNNVLHIKQDETIYFICQEAISNSVTHGRAKKINIVLAANEKAIELYIIDDGIGCHQVIENRGLNSIRKRVQSFNGMFTYDIPEEGGFRVRVSLSIMKSITINSIGE